ncbi:MAG: DUF4143 domain-containing protein [Methanomassiliicoccaceae archaeon]|nr:DUF4143 domain-containing protein [Methanomassiliicoccaceae archaeon]MCL2146118.1 DUF4143 domain-containing protein [Methanomassiliicoccaceae archaeon]
MEEYKPRLADGELRRKLGAIGAVLITGPKWCGKTTTAERIAKSAIYLHDADMREAYQRTLKVKPSLLLEGEKPRLIDEWQTAPILWDAVRYSVDRSSEAGQFILTGSTTVNESKILHSGAGRIGRMRMHTMSLYESGDSTGDVSLRSMFEGNEVSGVSPLSIEDVAALIVRGGWPGSLGKSLLDAQVLTESYCETILRSEVKTVDGVDRDSDKMRQVLRSLSRNVSTQTPDTTIMADMSAKDNAPIHINTLKAYEKTLREIYVIEDLPAWTPKLRSKTSVRTSDTRHLTDPAIAAYFLGATPKGLFADLKTFGLLFESMVVRDMRVYAQSAGGNVYHYRDGDGTEADAVIQLRDGRWGAVEVKLGSGMIDEAAENLLKIKNKIESESLGEMSFLAVVTASGYAYTREDGVHVVPAGCLKD